MNELSGTPALKIMIGYIGEKEERDVYRDFLLSKLPTPIKDAPASRLVALAHSQPEFPEWYLNSRAIDRQYLKELIDEHWRLQGPLDDTLENLQQDIHAFAEPLLILALKEQLNLELDVNATLIRLYIPANLAIGIDTNASRLRQSTLLEAALHNFEEPETQAGAFRDGSGIFTLDAENELQRHSLTVERFAALCRSLDIGAQYQQHIKALLTPEEITAKATVVQQCTDSEKAAFNESALIAYLKKDITSYGYGKLRQIRDNEPGILMGRRPLHCHRLSLMGFRLSGIVLFSAVADPSKIKRTYDALIPQHQRTMLDWSRRLTLLPGQEFEQFKLLEAFFANGPSGLVDAMLQRNDVYQQSRLDGTLIAYVPDDPEHPFKEYESFTDFMKELTSQLRSPSYQAFFSRFVAQKDKGKFFARVRERLSTFTWQQREPLNMGPWWRETAVENPDPEPVTNIIPGDLWPQMGLWRREKAIADARQIAVPTGEEDATTRWNRLSSYLNIGWNVFNFGAMLVPYLGEAMLAVMVGQMLFETMEGLEDWSKGDKEEGAAHLTGVMINFAQLAIMAAGHVLPSGAAASVKPSAFIAQLKKVEPADGKTRLWNPDLSPYAHDLALPDEAKPNELGLYRHGEKDILRHESKHFEVINDPGTGQPRLRHPTRPQAYQPKLEHNGAGVWKTELDHPLEWDKTTLMRRMGPTVEGFSENTLEQIRLVSGIEEDELRRLHVVSDPPPALLTNTIERFRTWADVKKLPEQIRLNVVPEAFIEQVPRLLVELPRWPELKSIELIDGAGHGGRSIKFGNVDALPANTLKISRVEVRAGKLPELAVKFVNETDIHAMLGQGVSTDEKIRIHALKNQLAERAGNRSGPLFEALDRRLQQTRNPQALVLQDAFSGLPTAIARELLADIKPQDLLNITEPSRIPLQLRERVRVTLQAIRTARAYEGLFLDSPYGVDTERLALRSLQALPNWPENVRIEIREDSFDGPLRDSIGPADASHRRTLVSEDGQYQAYDSDELNLHGADNLYASVLHALPDAERNALGYHINQGTTLKHAIQKAPLPRDTFRVLLADNPVRKPAYDPATMRLRGGMRGVAKGLRRVNGPMTPQERVRVVRPGWTEAEALAYLQAGGSDVSLEQRASALEAEFDRLNANFQRWLSTPTEAFRFTPAGIAEWQSRNALYKAVRECWQQTGLRDVDSFGNLHGAVLDLENMPLGRHLGTMPALEGNFDHVTRLNLTLTELTDAHVSFLDHFPRLRSLSINGNSLSRLPRVIGRMRALTELNLRGNRIVLDTQGVADLRNLTRLETLDMLGNPLGRVPDIGSMKMLHTLILADTGVHTWPEGLFAQPRFRHFYLDIQGNEITQIPTVPRGSGQAELLARTVLNREPQWLAEANLQTLRDYIESVGMDPDRPYPPRGVRDSLDWETGMTRPEWVTKQEVWNSVEDEVGSVGFFNEIRKLTESGHFRHDRAFRVDMTAKVWRMLDAMAKNTKLRQKLFTMTTVPTACVDAGAQLFNAMGLEVLIHETYELANPGLVETELVTLARGKSRLDELSRIARKTISEREATGEEFRRVNATGEVTGTIDEVEVHLAFMTDLANRLDLPWQSRNMQFRGIAGVTSEMIESAYRRVLDLEEGELLGDLLVEQPFWSSYVEGSNRSAFKGFRRRIDATTEFYMALDERATDTTLSLEEKARLKEELRVLGAELNKPESAFAPGRVMTEAEYAAELNVIDEDKKALVKTLTQQAIDRAKLQRVEIPFAVQPDD
ncbi:NEL-type E3 ubiquitin ligase domain-containing protein [Pseudomonas sp. RT6P73]